MRRYMVAILLAVITTAALGCSVGPRSQIEPLPDGLRSIAEYEPPRRPIEGRQFCMLIIADDNAGTGTIIERLESYLTQDKDWRHSRLGLVADWMKLHLSQPGRGLFAGRASDYLVHAPPDSECLALEAQIPASPEAVLVMIWHWER